MNTTSSPPNRAETLPPLPPEIRELSQEQWALWRQHPVTKAFHRYLRDYRQALIDGHMERFLSYAEQPPLEADARSRAAACQDMLDLTQPAVMMLYEPPTPTDN